MWTVAFAVTQLVEVPLAVVLLRDHPRLRVAGAAFLGSASTHPVFWFVAPGCFDRWWTYVVVSELVIAVVEGLILWRLVPTARPSVALAAAFRLNGVSFLVGLFAELAGLWPAG